MGMYVNPKDMTKEDWLANNGTITAVPRSVDENPGCLPVCLVDNGAFTAAGVAVDDRTLAQFSDPRDPRWRRWYWVEKALLPEVMIPREREQFEEIMREQSEA